MQMNGLIALNTLGNDLAPFNLWLCQIIIISYFFESLNKAYFLYQKTGVDQTYRIARYGKSRYFIEEDET